MNEKQRNVLFWMAGIIAFMFLYPPYTYPSGSGGYKFILDAPSYIDGGMLLLQCFGVCLVGGIIFYALKGTKDNKDDTK